MKRKLKLSQECYRLYECLHEYLKSKFINLFTDMQLYEFFENHFPEENTMHA